MNTFYFKDDRLFDNLTEAKNFASKFMDKTVMTIYTDNDFNTLTNRYKTAREQGTDILISLDYAVKYDSDDDFLNSHWLY